MFTREEATALLTAEKLAEHFTDAPTAHLNRAAMDKVRAVLRRPDRDYLQDVMPRIEVRTPVPVRSVPLTPDVRQRLLTSLANRQVVWLAYRTGYGNQFTQRHVEPIGLYFALHWHLVAFCRLRQEMRNFRLDRITDLRVLDELFSPRPETLDSYWVQQRARQPQYTVVLCFGAHGRTRIRDDKYFFGWVAEREMENGALEMTLVVPSLREVAHWLLYFGDQVHIVSSPELRQAVLALVSTAWQHHSQNEQPTQPIPA